MSCVAYRLADPCDLQAAQALLNDRYASRGYGLGHNIPADAHTFVAEVDGSVVATVSLVLDGDKAWLVRLASSARSTEILEGLFRLAHAHGTAISAATDLLIEVHPRHADFYAARFGFERFGEPTFSSAVGAPAQTMRIPVRDLAETLVT